MTIQQTGPLLPNLNQFAGGGSGWQHFFRFMTLGALLLAVLTVRDWARRHRSTANPANPAPSAPVPATAVEVTFFELFATASIPAVVAILTEVFAGSVEAFVLFRHGTIVTFNSMPDNLIQKSREILASDGPVLAGGPVGDFVTHELTKSRGYLVTGAPSMIFTYVSRLQLASDTRNMLAIGLFGRTKRHEDSQGLDIVEVVTFSRPAMRERGIDSPGDAV